MNHIRSLATVLLALPLLAAAAFAAPDPPPAALADPEQRVTTEAVVIAERIASEAGDLRVVRVVGGLEHPWAFAWLPDGRMLVTERAGNLLLIGDEQVTSLEGLPRIHHQNQGGILDLVLHPDYEANGWIYFTYSSPGDNDSVIGDHDVGTGTALARARLSADGTQLVDLETLYAQTPRYDPGRHYGSRILFPGDGTVLFTIGDRGLRWPAQDLTDAGGSYIRLNEDGGAYEGNPFVNQPPGNLRPEIFSFGHRNVQATTIHPETGDIWALDHGPFGGDLVYIVEAGNNYGWPQVSFGVDYSTREPIGIGTEAPGVTPPLFYWEESMAPSGLAYYDGHAFPGWRGDLFGGSLAREQLHRLVIDGRSVVREEILLSETIGRIRDVRQGPDGYLYLATDHEDAGIYRIEPAH
jgi:aldose sugar dehydrogenase